MLLPKKIMVLDTETIGLEKRYAYDIGFIIAELKSGRYVEIDSEHYAVKQVYDNKMLFETAYYANKRPLYVQSLKAHKMKRKHIGRIFQRIKTQIKKHKIDFVFAYNSPFDKSVMRFNSDYFKKANPIKNWIDIQGIASHYIHKTRQYKDFANKHKKVTPKGYMRTNAECTYQAITGKTEFKEQHMGLQDCRIELDILNECIKLGYNETKPLKKLFLTSELDNSFKITAKGKTYTFKYHSMKNTRNGLVLN